MADARCLAEEFKSDQTIELVDYGKAVAKVEPVHELEIPKGTVPDWFFAEPPPKFPTSVREQLRQDRRNRIREVLDA